MRRICIFNSLDDRYGSTIRLKALAQQLGHLPQTHVFYHQSEGSAWSKLTLALRCALGPYDVFFTQKFNPITLAALIIARLRGRKTLVDWDDFDPGFQNTRLKRWLSTLCEALGPYLAQVITTHSHAIEQVAHKRAPTVIVPQGFDAQVFHARPEARQQQRQRLSYTPADFVLVHPCTFTHGGALDLPELLRHVASLSDPQIKLLLIGDGPLRPALEAQIRQLGLTDRCHLTGAVVHTQIPDLLAASDVGLVWMSDTPSNRARVSFKVIEYLAMNLPVVGRVVGETQRLFGPHVLACQAQTFAATLGALKTQLPVQKSRDAVLFYDWSHGRPHLLRALDLLFGLET